METLELTPNAGLASVGQLLILHVKSMFGKNRQLVGECIFLVSLYSGISIYQYS
jgi:hypothetical protein